MTDGKCDMCSAPGPRWFYPAQDFQVMEILGSQGSWYACDLCAALIERGDREALANRAVDAIIALNPHLANERAWCLMATRQLHEDFWNHRDGAGPGGGDSMNRVNWPAMIGWCIAPQVALWFLGHAYWPRSLALRYIIPLVVGVLTGSIAALFGVSVIREKKDD